jgi:hypothetical protein
VEKRWSSDGVEDQHRVGSTSEASDCHRGHGVASRDAVFGLGRLP